MSRIFGYLSLFLCLSLGLCSFYKKYDRKIYSKLMKVHQILWNSTCSYHSECKTSKQTN